MDQRPEPSEDHEPPAEGIAPEVAELLGAAELRNLPAAIDLAGRAAALGAIQGRRTPGQMSLLPLPAEAAELEPATRGAGRPKGSVNRRTKDIAKWITRRYGDPLEFLAQVYSAPLVVLKAQLPGAEALDVLKLQAWAADKVAPYVASKMPVKVEMDGNLFGLTIIEAAAAGGVLGDDFEPETRIVEIEQNQRVSGGLLPPSDDPSSDESGQAIEIAAETGRSSSDRQSVDRPGTAAGGGSIPSTETEAPQHRDPSPGLSPSPRGDDPHPPENTPGPDGAPVARAASGLRRPPGPDFSGPSSEPTP